MLHCAAASIHLRTTSTLAEVVIVTIEQPFKVQSSTQQRTLLGEMNHASELAPENQ